MFLNKFQNVDKEYKTFILFFIGFLLLLFIIFYKERNPFLILKFYFGMIYLFIIPGFLILSLLFPNINITYRLFMALPFGSAIIGLIIFLSYTYFKVKLKNTLIFPIILFIIYFLIKKLIKNNK